ncbi:hypothetical protein BD779DRAFT_1148026 [Infundibulicybe gibba]|nr:hypothetical protein BD779DRAFT_1148026 [Infundibulicybe gibba]
MRFRPQNPTNPSGLWPVRPCGVVYPQLIASERDWTAVHSTYQAQMRPTWVWSYRHTTDVRASGLYFIASLQPRYVFEELPFLLL